MENSLREVIARKSCEERMGKGAWEVMRKIQKKKWLRHADLVLAEINELLDHSPVETPEQGEQ